VGSITACRWARSDPTPCCADEAVLDHHKRDGASSDLAVRQPAPNRQPVPNRHFPTPPAGADYKAKGAHFGRTIATKPPPALRELRLVFVATYRNAGRCGGSTSDQYRTGTALSRSLAGPARAAAAAGWITHRPNRAASFIHHVFVDRKWLSIARIYNVWALHHGITLADDGPKSPHRQAKTPARAGGAPRDNPQTVNKEDCHVDYLQSNRRKFPGGQTLPVTAAGPSQCRRFAQGRKRQIGLSPSRPRTVAPGLSSRWSRASPPSLRIRQQLGGRKVELVSARHRGNPAGAKTQGSGSGRARQGANVISRASGRLVSSPITDYVRENRRAHTLARRRLPHPSQGHSFRDSGPVGAYSAHCCHFMAITRPGPEV